MLWDVPEHEVCFAMLDTPDALIRYEQPELHIVSHIPAELRLTSITYQRDEALEAKMIAKCKAAQEYVMMQVAKIHREHA